MIGKNSMKHHYLKKKIFTLKYINMKDIVDADYTHAKRICKDFEIKNLGENHDLYVQSNTLLLTDEFQNFRIMCLKIYKLDPARFFHLWD